LALKLPEVQREKLFSSKPSIPLKYFPKSPTKKEYALFPEGIEKKDETLQEYVRESIAYLNQL